MNREQLIKLYRERIQWLFTEQQGSWPASVINKIEGKIEAYEQVINDLENLKD